MMRPNRTNPHTPGRALRRAAFAMLAAALVAPATAGAARLDTDEIAGVPLYAGVVSSSDAPDPDIRAGVLVGPDGRVLWSREDDHEFAMASITKIMTALVVLEKCRLDDVVTVTAGATGVGYATGLKAGERLTVRQLLELLLVASSNDAANALAIHTGGSKSEFARMMNSRAETLGLSDTRYANAHGLDEAGHHSSAADTAVLLRTAIAKPEFRRIIGMDSVVLPEFGSRKARRIQSTDELLGVYRGLLGGKTGFTDDAKYSFAAAAERDGVALTGVVLGAASNDSRFKQAAHLFDWGFAHLSLRSLTTTDGVVASVPVAANPARTVPARYAETTSVPVFDLDGALETKTTLLPDVTLPVFEGQLLGEAAFHQGARVLVRVPIVANEPVASAEETVGAVPVSDYLDRTVTVRADGSGLPVREYDPLLPVQRLVDLDDSVDAPVEKGSPVGEIVYSQNGAVIVRVPVVAAADVPEPPLLERVSIFFARGWRLVTGKPAMAQAVVTEG